MRRMRRGSARGSFPVFGDGVAGISRLQPNPQMQPTGRGGPGVLAGAAFLVATQWKR